MPEIWKPISGYEGYYQVSNLGRIRSLLSFGRTERIRVPSPAPNGYLRMVLSARNRRTTISIHRAVAQAFLPNFSASLAVNHKDCNKHNNTLNNLECITHKENVMHSVQHGRHPMKPVVQYTLEGEKIAEFPSASEAARRYGFASTNISKCCRGGYKTYQKYKWEYL